MNQVRKAAILGFAGTAACLLSGCATSPGGIAASTTPLEGRSYDVLGKTRGTDSMIRVLGIPVSGHNSTRDAIHDAERSIGADALIDVTVEEYFHYYILFSRNVTAVEGHGIRFKNSN